MPEGTTTLVRVGSCVAPCLRPSCGTGWRWPDDQRGDREERRVLSLRWNPQPPRSKMQGRSRSTGCFDGRGPIGLDLLRQGSQCLG